MGGSEFYSKFSRIAHDHLMILSLSKTRSNSHMYMYAVKENVV